MRLIITIGPDAILADDQIISDQVGAYIVRNSKLIQDIPMSTTNTKKVCVDFRATWKTPEVWRLPFDLLKRLY